MQAEFVLKEAEDLPGVSVSYPFDENTLVFKVAGKIFALVDATEFRRINLKCNPETALALRERYKAVEAGYHMNKLHWNTISFESDMPTALMVECLYHSYALVVSKLPKKAQLTLPPVGQWLYLKL